MHGFKEELRLVDVMEITSPCIHRRHRTERFYGLAERNLPTGGGLGGAPRITYTPSGHFFPVCIPTASDVSQPAVAIATSLIYSLC